MPLTAKGYDLQAIGDCRTAINQLFIQRFGEGIDMDDDQTPGLIAGILSEISSDLDSVAAGVYSSFFVLKSNGANLDDLGVEEGIFRKPATYATTDLQIEAYPQTTIPEGTEFSTQDGQIFSTTSDLIINSQASYVDDGGHTQPLTDDDGNPLGQDTVEVASLETGVDNNVMPNTIINSEEAIDGFYSCTNPNGATGGADQETDDQYRIRILANRVHPANSTVSGIETAIGNVDGVKDVRLVNNNTMETDQYGNPRKSIHLYVIGGQANDIAQALFDVLPPVTTTVGTVAGLADDVAGRSYTVFFDRATTVPIYIELDLKVDNTIFDSDASPTTIKNNVLNYFDTLSMGDSVLYSKLFGPAYSVQGVNDVVVKLGTEPPVPNPTDTSITPTIDGAQISAKPSDVSGTLQSADIPISDFQLAVTSVDDITVNVNSSQG